MADLGHLEKMGRELKCPICWNLLSSAVSLACNHAFCNSCILESMKSVSDCPVCKVPFHRREVRPAPHMDNLVSIFKSMEAAAGTSIFSTQLAPSDGLTQGNYDKNSGSAETAVADQGKSKKKGLSKKIMQKEKEKSDARNSDCHPSKMPSFPAKKRIHVTPYPISETPVRPEKASKLGDSSIELKDNKEESRNEKIAMEEQGDPLFSPFFWLREGQEEDNETAEEKLSGQQTADTPPPYNVPCFSDIKDSDSESPVKATPTSKHNAAVAFDSEMFEWTQRACSPELCSTPIKKQTAGRHLLNRIQERESQKDLEIGIASSDGIPCENVEIQIPGTRKRTLKRKRGKNNRIQKRQVKSSISRTACKVYNTANKESPADSGEVAPDSSQENEETDKRSPTFARKILKQCNSPASHHQMKHRKIPRDQVTDSAQTEASDQCLIIFTRSKNKNEEKGARGMVDKGNKRGKETTIESQRKHVKKSIDDSVECIKKSIDDSVAKILKEIPANSVNEAKTQNHNCHEKCLEHDKGSGNGRPRRGKKNQEKQLGESSAQQRMNNQTADLVVTKDAAQISPTMSTSLGGNIKTAINLHQESESLVIKNATKIQCLTLGDNILRKCENNHLEIQCAFCQSPNDTEDSEEMMHYFNGKPVAADFNGGVNVIHSHKNCSEWAPDVYFEDDIAINLAAELARSRRIKCSCCGIKGAALGCFEKSCRKSFHFTCAKLIPECRWDNENFVMLCPLHSSSKLPIETSETQKQTRKRYTPKGASEISSISKPSNDISQMWTWPSGLPCKWVICCSALSVAEKDIISKFTKMTAVPISKSWSPTVTHVIASTGKNGACKRTLKFLMAILDGKWIVSVDWIKACMEARHPVDEETYEITVDVHGISRGPQLGRLRAINKQPKLFNGISFYFSGDYAPSYKGYLQDLVIAAGGTVLQRKPVSRDQEKLLDDSLTSTIFIIYSLEHPEKNRCHDRALVFDHRQAEAQALADASGGKVAANTWIIDSIAACKLQLLKLNA